MIDDAASWLKAVDELKRILHHARQGKPDEEEAYVRLRRQLLAHPEVRGRMQAFLKRVRLSRRTSISAGLLGNRRSSRVCSKEMEPLRAWLEGLEDGSTA